MTKTDSVFAEILGRSGDDERPAILGTDFCEYGELRRKVEQLVVHLKDAGVGSGDRVGVSLDPGLGYLVALLAVRAAGATAVLFGTSWTPFEQKRCFGHSQPGWILSTQTPPVGESAEVTRECFEIGVELFTFKPVASPLTAEPDDAVIIYTSGTTGAPKGVVLSESALSANVRAVAEYLELTSTDSTAVFTPTCYAYAVSQFLTHALVGAAIAPVPTYLRFPMAVLQACDSYRLTGLAANPTAFRIFTRLEAPENWDFSSVRYIMSGGQFLDARLVASLFERFTNAGIVNMYGASENSPRISYYWLEDRGGEEASRFYPVGTPVGGTRIEIRDDDGKPIPNGEVGEIAVTGTSLMRGFWRDPAATAAKVRDGWLHTGDLGFIDPESRLILTGRQSNVINVGNDKVSPEDVERVLLEVPGIAEAGVYGVKDPVTGESVRAKVVVDAGSEQGIAEMQHHCRRMLSAYKVPREIQIVDALPRTLYGKLDRRKLKEEGA